MATIPGKAAYNIRWIVPGDEQVIAHQRVAMFRDMDELLEKDAAPLEEATRLYLSSLIMSGEYFGWLAEWDGKVVAGVGSYLHPLLPRGDDLTRRQGAYILNVYTEPEHRRKGLSRQLLCRVIKWCRENQIPRVTLHASAKGRRVYESVGFLVPATEMRLVIKS